jgi:hypothetical protein
MTAQRNGPAESAGSSRRLDLTGLLVYMRIIVYTAMEKQ